MITIILNFRTHLPGSLEGSSVSRICRVRSDFYVCPYWPLQQRPGFS
jgi:hypothetical protein